MNNIDFNLYENEHKKYKNLSSKLFFYQKHKDKPWNLGENFGDYLSKIVVAEVANKKGFTKYKDIKNQFLAIGSILHFAKEGDTIWGSGINGKISLDKLVFNSLNIKSVRGPLTKDILDKRHLNAPEIFGDPALLMPHLFPQLKYNPIKNKVTIIPNLNEYDECLKITPSGYNLISPLRHWSIIFEEILSSEIVYTSSLHGLIICETFNVPVRLFKPFGGETMFKYEDYLEGTSRKLSQIPKSFNQSFREKDGVYFKPLSFNLNKLIEQFPHELFLKD